MQQGVSGTITVFCVIRSSAQAALHAFLLMVLCDDHHISVQVYWTCICSTMF